MLYSNRIDMNTRPSRQIKAPQRLIEQDEPAPTKARTTKPKTPKPPKRTLNLDTGNDNPPVDVDKIIRETKAPLKPTREPKRTLNLDLSDIPPSDDIKFSKDFSLYNHPFWMNNFYTPKDNTTKVYRKAVEKLADILPANFQLYDDEPTAFGVANVELKEQLKKPIKRIPLLSKLKNGDYEIASSKSDNNIASSITFFRNNLPSFMRYKDDDDIAWVVNHHRLLIAETFDYYANKETKPSPATIKTKINAITRIFRIAYETKFYQLYDKYSSLVIFLGHFTEDDEFRNELSEIEVKKFITFDVVLKKQKELQTQFEMIQNKRTQSAYDLNQDLLLVSLYSLIPPLRNEVKTLKFSKTIKDRGDWVVFLDDGIVLLDLNEEKKRHDEITFNLTEEAPELAKILKDSYDLYPRDAIFTHYRSYPDVSKQATVQSLSDRITSIFSYTGKSVSVNTFRSSYVSYANSEAIKNGKQLTVREKEKIAYRMRTSRKYLDESYLKIFPIERQEIKQQERQAEEQVRPIKEELPAYQKQLLRVQKYYENNKETILEKQKAYKATRPAYDKARVRILHYLNNDADYASRMKDTTRDKYNFEFKNGRWI